MSNDYDRLMMADCNAWLRNGWPLGPADEREYAAWRASDLPERGMVATCITTEDSLTTQPASWRHGHDGQWYKPADSSKSWSQADYDQERAERMAAFAIAFPRVKGRQMGPSAEPARPKRVRLWEAPWPADDLMQEVKYAEMLAIIEHEPFSRNLRVVIEADAPEPERRDVLGFPLSPTVATGPDPNEVYADMVKHCRETGVFYGNPIPDTNPCPDCLNTPGKYQGLGALEDCQTCGGRGRR